MQVQLNNRYRYSDTLGNVLNVVVTEDMSTDKIVAYKLRVERHFGDYCTYSNGETFIAAYDPGKFVLRNWSLEELGLEAE